LKVLANEKPHAVTNGASIKKKEK